MIICYTFIIKKVFPSKQIFIYLSKSYEKTSVHPYHAGYLNHWLICDLLKCRDMMTNWSHTNFKLVFCLSIIYYLQIFSLQFYNELLKFLYKLWNTGDFSSKLFFNKALLWHFLKNEIYLYVCVYTLFQDMNVNQQLHIVNVAASLFSTSILN